MFVKLLVGPAASGKSTYTRAHKSEDEIVATEYYQFTDLIFYTECEVDDEIADRLRDYMIEHKDSYNYDESDHEIIQVIYRSIKPEYILEVK